MILLLFTASIAEALPFYNPAGPSLLTDGVACTPGPVNYCDPWQSMSLNVGFTGYYVNQHKMLVDLTNNQDKVRAFSYSTNAGYLSLNVCDRLEAYSAIGGTQIAVDFPPQAVNKPNSAVPIPLRLDSSYSLNVGGHYIAFCNGNFTLGFDAQYFWTKPRIISMENTQINQLNYKYGEWQFGGGGAYRINFANCGMALLPYFGIHYNRSIFDAGSQVFGDSDGDTLTFITLLSLRHVGYTFGTTLVGCNKIQITAAASFINETSFLLNSTFRF